MRPTRQSALLSAPLLLCAFASAAGNGNIVVIGDEWVLSNTAFGAIGNSAALLTLNAAALLDGNGTDIAIFSSHPRIGGSQSTEYRTTLGANGYSITVNPGAGYSLATMQQYDFVIVGGLLPGNQAPDAELLSQYVSSGGSVLLFSGTGLYGDAFGENAQWAPFLGDFGLTLSPEFFPGTNNVIVDTDATPHPLFTGVSKIFWGYGSEVGVADPSDPNTTLLSADFTPIPGYDHHSVIGIYQQIPSPGSLVLLATAGTFRRRRRN
ncbi:MAG: hypothetical protein FJ253_07605 [Phycisphaerae bacterium]|nr:hypothetical protein [Phycisphaerae bacterium]